MRCYMASSPRAWAASLILAVEFVCLSAANGQNSFSGVDLLYPEFVQPQKDAFAAIERRDFRFIMIDHWGTVPGVERYPQLKAIYGTRFIRQRFRIFATRSQNFSFNLRARTYARDYNQTLVRYLLERRPKE
jgi:hypothetical protein